MVKYLVGERLATEPYLNVYESAGPTSAPTKLELVPPLAGPVKQLRFANNQQLFAVQSSARRDEVEGLGNPSFSQTGTPIFSTDGMYMMFTGNPVLLKKTGPYYVPDPAFPALSGVAWASISNNADVVAVILSASPTVMRFYERSAGTWIEKSTLTVPSGATPRLTADGKYVYRSAGSNTTSIYYRNPATGVYAALTLGGTGYALASMDFLSGGKIGVHMTKAGYTSGTTYTDNFYVITDGVVASAGSFTFTPSNTDSLSLLWVSIAASGTIVATRKPTNNAASIRAFRFDGSAYVAALTEDLTGLNVGAGTGLQLSTDGRKIAYMPGGQTAAAPASALRLFTAPATPGAAFTLANTFSGYRYPMAFSPDGGRIFQLLGGSWIVNSAVAPFATVTVSGLPSPTNATQLTFSPDGKTLRANYASGSPVYLVETADNSFVNTTVIEGQFVTLYDRNGTVFKERAFMAHPLTSILSDFVISKANLSFLYHVNTSGRYVYDIAGKLFAQRGVEFHSGDARSLAAVSPFETHFVTVFDNPGGVTVKLYKFGTNRTYTQKDSDPVAFGPPAFSQCNTVLVAHGGEQPYTLFAHDTTAETLTKEVIEISDWENESEIVFAMFSQDCQSVVVATDDSISEIRDDSVTVTEPADWGPDGPSNQTDPDSNDDTISDTSGPGGGGGGWTLPPGGGLNNIAYLPYVSVNVTFRTW